MNKTLSKSSHFWWLYIAASLCLVPTIWFYYVGEEAVFPIAAIEMFQRGGGWLTKTRYGVNLYQNPMFVWLIIPASNFLGWEHMLEATRIIAISSTIGIGLTLAWLARKLTGDNTFGAFAALIFATLADLLFYRGWLAYVDPTFSFAIFLSIALCWIATIERRISLLGLALVILTLAFMIKTFTAYVFYGVALTVFTINPNYRSFTLSRASLLLHLAGYIFPFIWYHFAVNSPSQGGFMLWEITDKLSPHNLGEYLVKFFTFPVETLLRLSPAAIVAIYFSWKQGSIRQFSDWPYWSKAAFWIATINTLPYWLAPTSAARYLMPLYPFFALIFSFLIWNAGKKSIEISRYWLTGLIIVQVLLVCMIFPYYQQSFRGENYLLTAKDILKQTAGQPLFTANGAAHGMSVVAYIDALQHPKPAISIAPATWDSGFVIALTPTDGEGNMTSFNSPARPQDIFKRYQLGGDVLYLLCRGSACQQGKPLE